LSILIEALVAASLRIGAILLLSILFIVRFTPIAMIVRTCLQVGLHLVLGNQMHCIEGASIEWWPKKILVHIEFGATGGEYQIYQVLITHPL
jgi:hypothetical protein